MPNNEQLGIICLLALLGVLYVIAFIIRFLIEYWYVVATVVVGLVALRIWWRRRYPCLDDDDEDGDLVPVLQE